MAERSQVDNEGSLSSGACVEVPFGADDFLPIFIFCVVKAEIERPCALCKAFYYYLEKQIRFTSSFNLLFVSCPNRYSSPQPLRPA